MRTFFAQVNASVPAGDDLLLIGDGEVVDHFRRQLPSHEHGSARRVEVEKSGPLTEPQMLARIRAFAGSPARRSVPG
jgi:hypothetical protein